MKLATLVAATACAREVSPYHAAFLTEEVKDASFFDEPAAYRIAELECMPKLFCDKFRAKNCGKQQYSSLLDSINSRFVRCGGLHGELLGELHTPALDCNSADRNKDWLDGDRVTVFNRMKDVFKVTIREFIYKSDRGRCDRQAHALVSMTRL